MNSIPYLAAIAIFFSIAFYWIYHHYSVYLENVAAGRLAEVKVDPKKLGALRLCILAVRKSPIYGIAEKIKWFEPSRKKLERTILACGLKGQIDSSDIFGTRILLCLILPGFMAALSFTKTQNISWMIYMIPFMGWIFPTAILSGIKVRRHRDILLAFPFVLDLLTLSTEAGLDFMGALGKVAEKAPRSPLVEELEEVINQIKLGSSRAEALRAMAYRVDLGTISSFIAVLIANEQMGAGIGKVLRAQSDSVRQDRFVRAEKAGARATQLMLFPLIFLILPAVFLMIFGPVIVSFMYGGVAK